MTENVKLLQDLVWIFLGAFMFVTILAVILSFQKELYKIKRDALQRKVKDLEWQWETFKKHFPRQVEEASNLPLKKDGGHGIPYSEFPKDKSCNNEDPDDMCDHCDCWKHTRAICS